VLAAVAALLPVTSAAADPYPVTSLADSGPGSLRQAIEEANVHPGEDSIPIDVTGTIELSSELPAVTGLVEIVGPGADSLTIERDAVDEFCIFRFMNAEASLSGVTITGGVAPQGGGILNDFANLTLTRVVVTGNEAVAEDGGLAEAQGGGIRSFGWLVVRESVIRDNAATASNGSARTVAQGGGILASDFKLERSTVSGNSVEAFGEGGEEAVALGAGLVVLGKTVMVQESTVSGNSALATGGAVRSEARGGGLQGRTLSLSSSTVTGNSVTADGPAFGANIAFDSGTLIRNTIVANAIGEADSCNVPQGSTGFNLDEDGSCGFSEPTDLTGAAGLDPVLRDNGGPTPTHALLPGSPALDRGSAFGSSTDQRGLPRPVDFATVSNTEGGDGSDIGAFELQALPVPPATSPRPKPILITPVAGDRQPPNTRIASGPARVTFKRLATFRFASTEAQSSFQCRVDKRRWRECASPYARKVSAGKGAGRKHVFQVRAIDRFGNVDPTPARFGWRVKKIEG
jgi:hypothetical protein